MDGYERRIATLEAKAAALESFPESPVREASHAPGHSQDERQTRAVAIDDQLPFSTFFFA